MAIHYTRLHDTYYTTLHYITLHYHYTTLHYTIYHTTLHYTTPHDITLHYTTLITPHHDYNCNCTSKYSNYITATAPLHYTTTTATTATTTTNTTPHYIQHYGKVTIATIPKNTTHNSNNLSVHQWIRSAIRDSQQPTSPIGSRFLKLPPPPCAVLLVKSRLQPSFFLKKMKK